MSSGGIRISQQNYYSTHNALVASLDDQSVRFVLHELDGTRHGALRIFPFYDIQMIKRLLIKKLALPPSTRVKDLRILYKGQELPNYRTMDCYINNNNNEQKLYWCLKESPSGSGIRPLGMKMGSRMQNIFNEIVLSMQNNIKPKLTMDGTGGTYEMFNKAGKCIAMFKPSEEEAFTPYNPRGYVGNMNQQGFRPGVLSGEGATREVAAYILDVSYDNFSSVPATTMVEIAHQSLNNNPNNYSSNINSLNSFNNYHQINPFTSEKTILYNNFNKKDKLRWKVGSLQEFVISRGTSGNYNPNMFTVEDVHKIGILDIRVLNLDRNDGNILVVNNPEYNSSSNNLSNHDKEKENGINKEKNKEDEEKEGKVNKYKLIPIDHGLILPDIIDICDLDWVWYEWPQSKEPFTRKELEKIFSFNVDKDIERLKKYLHIRDECLRTIKVTTKFLQIASSMKLNLHQIATIIVRQDIEIPSELELIIKKSIEQVSLCLITDPQAYKITDSTNLITTNRLGNAIDLIENAVNPIVNIYSDYENITDNENNQTEEDHKNLDFNELPSSTFFQYPTYFNTKNNTNGLENEHNNHNKENNKGNEEKNREDKKFKTTVRRRKNFNSTKSTWSLVDSKGHLVLIDWDVKFQNLFFKILEEMFVGNIKRLHPDWNTYPYFGPDDRLYDANHKNQMTLPFTTLWFNN